jgi:hypothetical protein
MLRLLQSLIRSLHSGGVYMTERERITSVLKRQTPDRIPWATRLDIWFGSHTRMGDLPPEYQDADIMAIHHDLGVGRQSYVRLYTVKLPQVEMIVEFNGQKTYHETSPLLKFPHAADFVSRQEIGETVITFKTPVGNTYVQYTTNEEILNGALQPFLTRRILSEDSDYAVVHWILDHSEIVPDYESFLSREAEIGEMGMTIGTLDRVPFQRILLDYLGEERCFYEMFDHPDNFTKLSDQLSEIHQEFIRIAVESPALMVEHTDNFDGQMTNPRLFKHYCLPHLQATSEKVHAAGKVLGSHMDGDMRSLAKLVPDTGVDIVESFSPAPLTSFSFREAWDIWNKNVLIWGAIPSIIFEDEIPQNDFEHHILDTLATIMPDGLIILGIGDQAVKRTRVDRMKQVGMFLEQGGYYAH